MLFEGFTIENRRVGNQELRLRRAGNGPPLLLLHGNPQTHMMWHRIAPLLAQTYTVICPDLPGYGFSGKPPLSADHAAYSKRAMAAALAGLMHQLGHERFQVVSHDRGARVAHRMVLDFPHAVERLCTMDIVPTIEHFERTDMAFAMGYYHWFFLAQPHPKPETMIRQNEETWFDLQTSREPKDQSFFHPEARADYVAALRAPGTIEAICEEYRAGATIDLEHDRASRTAGDKVQCPLLALWGAKGKIGQWYEPLTLWQRYASGPVTGGTVDSGHYLAEETPEEVMVALRGFLKSGE